MSKEIAKKENISVGFGTADGFELLQRQAGAISKSTLVPKNFQGNLPDCIVGMELASRIGASPLMVLQNLHVIHGKPSFSSAFQIACFNTVGKYAPIRYEFFGKEGTDDYGCLAFSKDLEYGDEIRGPKVTIEMAKKEGWFQKSGSKWQTIPELMLRYRAAAFMIRTTAPELTMGLGTVEEALDIQPAQGVVVEPIFDKVEVPLAEVIEPEIPKPEKPKKKKAKKEDPKPEPKPEPVKEETKKEEDSSIPSREDMIEEINKIGAFRATSLKKALEHLDVESLEEATDGDLEFILDGLRA